MSTRASFDLVDRLAALAADADAPPLDELTAHRFVERAVASMRSDARVTSRSRTISRWAIAAALASTLAITVLVTWLVLRPRVTDEPLRLALPTGDSIVGTDGARFAIEELAPASRRF